MDDTAGPTASATDVTTRAQLLETNLADAFARDGSPSRPPSAIPENRGTPGESALPKNIPQAILAHMQPGVLYSRADITEARGISHAAWTWAIRQLKGEGQVSQCGERRGAPYRRAAGGTQP